MSTEILVPALGGEPREAVIAEWYKADGDAVRPGEAVYRLETDFVAVDIEAEEDGVLRHWIQAGELRLPGQVVALILEPGELFEDPQDDADNGLVIDITDFLPAAARGEPVQDAADAADEWLSSGEDDEDDELTEMAAAEPVFEAEESGEPVEPEGGSWASAMSDWARSRREALAIEGDAPPMPLMRRALPPAPPIMAGSAWDSVPGDNQDLNRGGWGSGSDDAIHQDLRDALESSEDEWEELEPPVKDPSAPLPDDMDSVTPLLFRNNNGLEEMWLAEHSGGGSPVLLTLKVSVHMAEARKMRDQLAREWRAWNVAPDDDDIVVRALARAAMEDEHLRQRGDSIGLVLTDGAEERVAVLEGASRGQFRERVESLSAARQGTPQGNCVATVTSFAAFGLDEGTPPLPDDHPFALSVGAIRSVYEVGQIPVPMVSLVLAYTPELMAVGQAARLLGRVKELLEAPYALFAD